MRFPTPSPFLFGLLVSICAAAGPAGATDESIAAAIDRLVAPYVTAGDFAGVVAVGRDGEAPMVRAYGRASVELNVPHRPDGVFMIGSISKQFTAAAILLLAQDGALATEDPVGRHLPSFAHGDRVTIEQLLTHTAGVADVYSLERFGATDGQVGTLAEVVADLGAMPLTHEPGAAFAYSNGGYSVLAAVIERVSGTSYGDFLARRIFRPLGMTSTAHDAAGPAAARRVPGYDPWGVDGLTPARPVTPAYTAGSGSLWSSGADLLRWGAALHGGEVLAPASYAKLTTVHRNGYAYGVSVFQRFGRNVIGHDGRVAGYAGDLARYVDDRVTVVILSNVQSVARDEIRRLVAAAIFGEELEPPPLRVFANRDVAGLEEMVGIYSFGPTLDVSISIVDGRLLARANQGGFSELTPLGKDGWFSRMLYTSVRFGRDAEGRVDRLLWGLGEGAPAGRRVLP